MKPDTCVEVSDRLFYLLILHPANSFLFKILIGQFLYRYSETVGVIPFSIETSWRCSRNVKGVKRG